MLENELLSEAASNGIDPHEAQGIIAVLDVPEVRAALEHAEKWRRIKFGIYALAMTVTLGGIFYLSASGGVPVKEGAESRPSEWFDAIPMAIVPAVIFTILLFVSFKGSAEKNLKQQIVSRFLHILEPASKYSTGVEHAFAFGHLVSKGFLNSYDQIDTEEDSFEFTHAKDGKSISVRGMELVTSQMQGSGKNRKRVVTNRCFLMRGEYPDTKFKIDKDIFIRTDYADSVFLGILTFLVPAIFAFAFALEGDVTVNGVTTHYSNSTQFALSIALVAGALVWYLVRYFVNRNRVKLENIAFEKLFDVKCEDQILSRMVLTPAFMDRLVRFVEKTKGRYEFFFEGELLYVKKMLTGSFLEISGTKNLKNNTKTFLRWYAELKEIVTLISDTGVLVFSRTDRVAMNPSTVTAKVNYPPIRNPENPLL